MAAHGYLRFTKDVDPVVELIPDNIERVFAALRSLGYKPTVPITSNQFANGKLRASWIRDKGMQVLQFWCDAHIETPIDVLSAMECLSLTQRSKMSDRDDLDDLLESHEVGRIAGVDG